MFHVIKDNLILSSSLTSHDAFMICSVFERSEFGEHYAGFRKSNPYTLSKLPLVDS